MEWILAIAGILFGGGMIGNLIIFFVKRYDENKSKQKDIYKKVYEKLLDYITHIEQSLLEYYKYHNKIATDISNAKDNTDEIVKQIDDYRRQIKKYERMCKKNGINEDNCTHCKQIRSKLLHLYDNLDKNYTDSKEAFTAYTNYWNDNEESISSLINNNMNIHHYLSVCKDKKIKKVLFDIDLNTIKIHKTLYNEKNYKKLPDIISKQMELLEYSLIILSNKL